MKTPFAAPCLAVLLLTAASAHAQLVLSTSGGNEVSVGPGTAGFSFTTGAASETVRAVGVFDASALDAGLFNSHTVGIWDSATHALLASAVVPASGAVAIGSFQYVNLAAPLPLAANHSFTLGAFYADNDFDLSLANVTSVSLAPNNGIGHALLSTGSGFGFPDLDVSGANLGFFGPNVSFNAVPEPAASAALAGLALLAFAALRRLRLAP